ncbi:nuclear transport factor 2 family protein [Pseudarthrobacter sp. MDT3-28]|uniref:nuclear transport factor 2 family protein n=1 Tax=Pseudarthrobacter raffinosi TaxID=2953651 RepID=UPI00208EDAAE|nr:nuclear transport factor 2 family protein [Pseudarthrobacter sp. MDT3-28]MCO4236965.1 nuclear transport factor 2 family protein [Pseudarthrobacter sp. MDT3-28]
MGQARDVMDRLTTAMSAKDKETLAGCYAEDAVAFTPDEGELTGREGITNYLVHFWEALPDVTYEYADKHEAGNVAIDEGFVTGTNTGPLSLPSGETLPATGKHVRVRSCDIARVEGGLITSHHFYFDQMDFLGQLGLLPELSKH